MPSRHCILICQGFIMLTAGGAITLCMGLLWHSAPFFGIGLFVGLVGLSMLIGGLCMAMKTLQGAVPGHSLLHPRTGTRFSPQQALALQRRLDRIRREMSEDSVSRRAQPEPSLPSTPPPWTMEPPPSYDTVMKIQERSEQLLPEPT